MYLICGYKGTGKDYLYHQFKSIFHEKINFIDSEYKWNWKIYVNPNINILLKSLTIKRFFKRIAFADKLKEEVRQMLYISPDVNLNSIKNKQFGSKTFREHLIEVGQGRKHEDPQYWVKAALEDIADPSNIMITDWRFQEEFDYIKENFEDLITIRVFRKSVPIPDPDNVSERSLDHISTDFVLIHEDDDFESLLEIFPQYANYVIQ